MDISLHLMLWMWLPETLDKRRYLGLSLVMWWLCVIYGSEKNKSHDQIDKILHLHLSRGIHKFSKFQFPTMPGHWRKRIDWLVPLTFQSVGDIIEVTINPCENLSGEKLWQQSSQNFGKQLKTSWEDFMWF